jgi:hypothetical protein
MGRRREEWEVCLVVGAALHLLSSALLLLCPSSSAILSVGMVASFRFASFPGGKFSVKSEDVG